MRLGVNGQARDLPVHLAGERIEVAELFHLVVEQLDADRLALRFRRKHVDDLAAHPVGAALELVVVARVLHLRQPAQDEALVVLVAPGQVQHHGQVGGRVAQAVNGGDRGHDERVVALQQRLGGGQAHLLDVVVDGGVLLDEGVRGGNVGLRLIIIVVGDEVLYRVVREELPELPVELGRQRLVGRHDQGRPLHLGDYVGHGKRLARAGDAQERLASQAVAQALDHVADGGGLVAGGLVVGNELKAPDVGFR